MWRRLYLLLLVVRLYFALSPSYLHPDENFQGPEVIAGEVFSYPVHHTWEFTSSLPIRSVFPLWLVYGLPMVVLRWLWGGLWHESDLPPYVVYWTLRILMFTLSFVLEDWAVFELTHGSKRVQRVGVLLVASSYVTWTYQSHTFSNAIETVIVLWCLVIIDRIKSNRERTGAFACGILAFLCVLGVFNRITFPAYLIVPGLQLLRHFRRKPFGVLAFIIFGIASTFLALFLDTAFYRPDTVTFKTLLNNPVITPWNNLIYNTQITNLATHGLHPWYQHILANLPQLVGPAFFLVPLGLFHRTSRLVSAITGIAMLSIFPHQEARFLIPAVPLLLSSLRIPRRLRSYWIASWIIFNAALGLLMGYYHQGGIVPMQIRVANEPGISHVFWWKTYSPPIWLLDGKIENITTTDLMGMSGEKMEQEVLNALSCDAADSPSYLSTLLGINTEKGEQEQEEQEEARDSTLIPSTSLSSPKDNGVYLVAPWSATFIDDFTKRDANRSFVLEEKWRYHGHLNLDDLDFGDEGVVDTLGRVVGRRGLVLWKVERRCD